VFAAPPVRYLQKTSEMNGYELSRIWFNFCFDNPELIKPGFPSQMTMEAIGVKKHQTYSAALNELEEWGFITFIERSKNQWSANIISINAMPKNGKARGKALDKATIKHRAKQGHGNGQSTGQSMDSIVKPINQETNKPINQERENASRLYFDDEILNDVFSKWLKMCKEKGKPYPLTSIEALQMKLNRQSTQHSIKQVTQSLEKGWLNLRAIDEIEKEVSAQEAEQMDIAILKHMRDVQSEIYNNQPSENNRMRRIS
jgi:hypothetical protein